MKVHPNSQIIIKQAEDMPQDETANQDMINKWLKKNKPSKSFRDEKSLKWHTEEKMNYNSKQYVDGEYYRG